MSTASGVKGAKGNDGAPAKCQVARILVFEAASARAEIESSACKYTIKEVTSKLQVHLEEGAEMLNIVIIEVRCPRRKNTLKVLLLSKRCLAT